MIIPKATAKQALCIIDVQPQTLRGEGSKKIVKDISTFIATVPYDAYIVVEYFAPESSMMSKETGWTITKKQAGSTDQTILTLLQHKEHVCYLHKTDRSCFALENQDTILAFLKELGIEEVHLVGFDTDSCILASLYGGLACNLYSFVLEELTHHHSGNEQLHNSALTIFRHCRLSNNNLHPKIPFVDVDFNF